MYDWLVEKHQAASEEITDLSNIRGKYQRHQAFEAELAASKDKLDQIKEVCINCLFRKAGVAHLVPPPGGYGGGGEKCTCVVNESR